MGGSGGGSRSFGPSERRKLEGAVAEARETNLSAEFGTKLNGKLKGLLASANTRDAALVQQRIDKILTLLGRQVEGNIEPKFGGSVAKHTFVDGISDVDVLFLVDKSDLADETPDAAVDRMLRAIGDKLGKTAEVDRGKISVRIKYTDGMELQILPALKTDAGLKVPAWSAKTWSKIDPKVFAQELTKRNADHNGMVVPVIKLAKAINVTLPEPLRLSGYHLESLAIDAFRGYGGDHTYSKMLMHFFEHASKAILKPITDKSGQSVHVDEYMGAANSKDRQQAAHVLTRMVRRMANANATGSVEQWESLFED